MNASVNIDTTQLKLLLGEKKLTGYTEVETKRITFLRQDLYSHYTKARKHDPTERCMMSIKTPLTAYELWMVKLRISQHYKNSGKCKLNETSIFTQGLSKNLKKIQNTHYWWRCLETGILMYSSPTVQHYIPETFSKNVYVDHAKREEQAGSQLIIGKNRKRPKCSNVPNSKPVK